MKYNRHFPHTRMRRMRMRPFSRALMQESRLAPEDLIWPVFVCEDAEKNLQIPALPGVSRIPLRALGAAGKKAAACRIPAMALFPVIPAHQKSPYGQEALNPDGLIPRAIRIMKKSVPKMGIITDVALDPYTSHGHDGIINAAGEVVNDGTLEVLKNQALCLAQAGSDILAPSDMMDGRIGVLRQALDRKNFQDVLLLSYAAKYASAFYGPFRDAIGSQQNLGKRDKRGYQMSPANADEALHETALDIHEGADIVMVKPGMCYLDIVYRIKTEFRMPTFAYQVSGEYAMLKSAGNGKENERALFLEALLAFKRAGADAILSYYALDCAQFLVKR